MKHQILFQTQVDAILCIDFSFLCTIMTSVITIACLQKSALCVASPALNYQLCIHRARIGAQSSAGRVLGNLVPRDRIF